MEQNGTKDSEGILMSPSQPFDVSCFTRPLYVDKTWDTLHLNVIMEGEG